MHFNAHLNICQRLAKSVISIAVTFVLSLCVRSNQVRLILDCIQLKILPRKKKKNITFIVSTCDFLFTFTQC